MTNTTRKGLLAGVAVLVIAGLGFAWYRTNPPTPPEQRDEALVASREASSFPAADEDYFRDMDQNRDGPVTLSVDEIRGRNTWIVWSAGNDRLWDTLSVTSGGALDFLKVVSSHPSQSYSRANRWDYFGLVNEPCFTKPTGGSPARWGLWVDQRQADCPPDPFENATKYPGVQTGSRGQTLNGKPFDTGSFYGYATGIVGLRLFPNPNFDEQAAKRWDAERYYTDRTYYEDKSARPALPRGYVVRVLPCRSQSDQAARRSQQPGVGQPELQRRRSVLHDRSHLLSGCRLRGLRVPDLSCVAAGLARHLIRRERQHQQPADDERDVLDRPAPAAREALGQGDAGWRWARQPSVQQLHQGRPARHALRGTRDGVGAARAQGRRRLGGCARCPQPRVSQHRHVQRGVDAALPAPGRSPAADAAQDRSGAAQLCVFQGDRGTDPRHGEVLSQDHRRSPSRGCPRRRRVSDHRREPC